jgi:hypothetical protein
MTKSSNSFDNKEVEQRLQKILRGAFSGPPTPLKAVPKKNGVSRKRRITKDPDAGSKT